MTPWSWSLMNKVAFLGPIRFKSILMPDLDSTAKSNPRNNVFKHCRVVYHKILLLSKLSSMSRRITSHFWCWNTKIEIAVAPTKHEKQHKTKQKVEIFRIFTFHQYQLRSHKTKKTKKLKGVYIRCKLVKFSMEWLWTLPWLSITAS